MIIAGTGLVSALGASAPRTWDALLAGRFITDTSRALLPDDRRRPRVTALALHAAREAIENTGWSARELSDDATALVVGTSKGPADEWLAPPPPTSDKITTAGRVQPTGLGEIASSLASELGLGCGPHLTVSAACAGGLHALIRGALMIQWREAKRVVVVAAESSLHPLFLAAYRRLGVLARPGVGCRPFDVSREGFVVSEAAAAVCLEEPSADNDTQVAIERFILGADATHLTGMDPNGATLRRLLAEVAPAATDLVHAHATGTLANDAIELAAIEAVVGAHVPAIYSHKGTLGHSLGASGLISIVLNDRMHREGVVLPNVQTRTPIASAHVAISRDPVHRPIRCSVVLAGGFGGAAAALALASR